ncbi:MAG: ATP-binding protein [Armatimonadota bacterium]
MRSITFKITLLVSILFILAAVLIIYLSLNMVGSLFYEYTKESLEIHDAFPYVRDGKIIMGPVEREFLTDIFLKFLLIGLSITLLAVAAGYFIARHATSPIRKLYKGVREIENGNLDYRVDVKTKDELGNLADSFNLMTEELYKAQILRKQFFADAAHELKTPLSVIKGNLEGMIDEVIPVDKAGLSSILEEAEYLNNIINDIRELALADSGQLALNKKQSDVNEIIKNCVNRLKIHADEKSIKIELGRADNPLTAFIDPERFMQVVYNLLTNALKYTPEGGIINIETEKIQKNNIKYFKVSVKDTGQGIPPEDLPHVFERFYRTDKSRNRETGGTGLGLAIVFKITQLHAGTAEAESTPGKGSTFRVLMPVK